jgi:hypothetical protein
MYTLCYRVEDLEDVVHGLQRALGRPNRPIFLLNVGEENFL